MIEKNKKIFAERLKKIRTEKGYSQYKLAEIMQCARTTISSYELGRNEPSFSDLVKLSNLFTVSAEWLMGNTDDPTTSNKTEEPTYEVGSFEWFRQFLLKQGFVKEGEDMTDEQLKIVLSNLENLVGNFKKRSQD